MQPVVVLVATADRFPSALWGRQNAISEVKGHCKVGMGNTCVTGTLKYSVTTTIHSEEKNLHELGSAGQTNYTDLGRFMYKSA